MSTPREKIHWDTCGPMVKSTKGSYYIVLGVDDATRYAFVRFLKTKDGASQTIKDTVSKINTQRGAGTVKWIHSDNGGEFFSTGMEAWLAEHGIKQTSSASYTPEHTGVIKRGLQTIVGLARCMLIACGLPLHF